MQDLRTLLYVRKTLAGFLQEDIGTGDITSENTVSIEAKAKAEIICKSDKAILCGLEEASVVFDIAGCKSQALLADGAKVKKGKAVMRISGNARDILKAERTALNLMMRMSGIATETHNLVRLAGTGVKILATRKTALGLRYFDKKAVAAGGGGTHRMRLDDMVLIKNNHLAVAGLPADCIKKAKSGVGHSVKIECEVRNTAEAIDAAATGADMVMLDNFSPGAAAKAIKTLSSMGLRKKCKVEISGGVNERNIRSYAKAKPDFISVGYITHSSRAIDFSLAMTSI